jgi:hypothetical protein
MQSRTLRWMRRAAQYMGVTMKKIILAAVLSILTAGVSNAQQVDVTQNPNAFNREFTTQRFAIGGKKSVLGNFYSLKPDCAPMDWIQVKIVKTPENGDAKLVDANTLPNYTAPNPRVKCNDRSVKSHALEYTPAKGYVGADSIELELIDSAGARVTYTYNITVK